MTNQTSNVILNEWLNKIESLHPSEIELGLSRIKKIAKRMNLLIQEPKIIIVGGTNGKGSCVAVLESLALNAQLSVGTYTSPHLLEFNERIKHNGKSINDEDLIRAFNKVEKSRNDIPLTFFEFTTLAALFFFSQHSLDLIVLEVGLGGRLDAVNIIEPDVAIITTIDKDHTDWLGDSLESIAKEKMGIFRGNSFNLVGDERTLNLVNQWDKKAVYRVRIIDSEEIKSKCDDNYLSYISDPHFNQYRLLRQNIELAFESFMFLFNKKNYPIDFKHVIKSIKIAGRFQILDLNPLIVSDVGHNEQAAKNLVKQMKSVPCDGKRIALCGLMADKCIKEFIGRLDESIDCWYFVDLPIERAAKAIKLMAIHEQIKSKSKASRVTSLENFVKTMNSVFNANDQIYVLGSFITVAEFMHLSQKL